MPADWLNYHHLLYFWMVAREGSMAAAGERLHLAQPTLSTQIKQLERSLGVQLFEKRGRQLVLTDAGRTVYRYADEIFELGREMTDVLRGLPSEGTLRLAVGVPDVLPKLIVYRLLQPALRLEEEVSLETREGKFDQLMVDLASHRLDVVLSETPLSPHSHIRAFNHELGECGLTCFATRELADRYGSDFPRSLDGAPMLLPTQNSATRRALELWFDQADIRPNVRHEFEDSALLKVFGQGGSGIFPAPTAIEQEVCRQYRVHVVGHLPDVKDRFYAISVERRLKHPAVLAICKSARKELGEKRRAARN